MQLDKKFSEVETIEIDAFAEKYQIKLPTITGNIFDRRKTPKFDWIRVGGAVYIVINKKTKAFIREYIAKSKEYDHNIDDVIICQYHYRQALTSGDKELLQKEEIKLLQSYKKMRYWKELSWYFD